MVTDAVFYFPFGFDQSGKPRYFILGGNFVGLFERRDIFETVEKYTILIGNKQVGVV